MIDGNKNPAQGKTEGLEQEQMDKFESVLKYIRYIDLFNSEGNSTEKKEKKEKKDEKELCISTNNETIQNIITKVEKMDRDSLESDINKDKTLKFVTIGINLEQVCSHMPEHLRFLLVEYSLQKGQNPFADNGILGNPWWLPNWLGITGQILKSNNSNVIKLNRSEMSLSKLAKLSQENSSIDNEFNFWHWFVEQSFSLYSENNLFDLFSLEQMYGWFGNRYFEYIRGFYEEKFGEDFDLDLLNRHLLKALSSIKGDCEFTGVIFGFAFSASVTSSFLVIVIPSFWIFLTIPVGTLAGYGIGKLVGKLKCDKISSSKDCYHTGSSISSGYSSDSNMSLSEERDSGNGLLLDGQKGREKQGKRKNNSRKKTSCTSSSTVPLVVFDDDNKNK